MKISDAMQEEVYWVLPDEDIEVINEKMNSMNIRSCVVCNENKEVIGILTDSDLVLRGIGGDGVTTKKAKDVMTPQPRTIGADDDAITAVTMMRDNHFRRLPVVKEGKLIGIVSLTDLAPFVISFFRKQNGE